MDDNIIDVNIENKFYTIEEVAEITDIDAFKISFYSEKLGDILKINKVGMYQVFDNIDVSNINRIKSLEEEGKSISQIRDYLINSKNEVLLERKVEPTEKDFLDFFVEIIHRQNLKIDEVIKANNDMVEVFKKIIDTQVLLPASNEEILKEVGATIDSKLENLKNEINQSLKENIEEQNKEMKDDLKYVKERLHFAYVTEKEIEENKKQQILDFLNIDVDVRCVYKTRDEIVFGRELKKMLKLTKNILKEYINDRNADKILKIEEQYKVLNYRIDFFMPYFNIAIEYDENNHKNYTYEQQEGRQKEIEKYFEDNDSYIIFIRVKQGEESKMFGELLGHIIGLFV